MSGVSPRFRLMIESTSPLKIPLYLRLSENSRWKLKFGRIDVRFPAKLDNHNRPSLYSLPLRRERRLAFMSTIGKFLFTIDLRDFGQPQRFQKKHCYYDNPVLYKRPPYADC